MSLFIYGTETILCCICLTFARYGVCPINAASHHRKHVRLCIGQAAFSDKYTKTIVIQALLTYLCLLQLFRCSMAEMPIEFRGLLRQFYCSIVYGILCSQCSIPPIPGCQCETFARIKPSRAGDKVSQSGKPQACNVSSACGSSTAALQPLKQLIACNLQLHKHFPVDLTNPWNFFSKNLSQLISTVTIRQFRSLSKPRICCWLHSNDSQGHRWIVAGLGIKPSVNRKSGWNCFYNLSMQIASSVCSSYKHFIS